MKKLIFSVSLSFITIYGHTQTRNTFDQTTNPSGVGFGGVTGGANVPNQRGNDFGSTNLEDERNRERQEERGNFPGGSLGGEGPSNSVVPPSAPRTIPSGQGPSSPPIND